jgi:hypothetical protein
VALDVCGTRRQEIEQSGARLPARNRSRRAKPVGSFGRSAGSARTIALAVEIRAKGVQVVGRDVEDLIPTLDAIVPLPAARWISHHKTTFSTRDGVLFAIPVTDPLLLRFLDCD